MQKSFQLSQLELEAQLCEDYINQNSPGRVANFSFTFNALQKSLENVHENEALQTKENSPVKVSLKAKSKKSDDDESGFSISSHGMDSDEIESTSSTEPVEIHRVPRVQQLIQNHSESLKRDEVVDRLLQEYREKRETGMAALDDDDHGRGFFANVSDVSYNAQLVYDTDSTSVSELPMPDMSSSPLRHRSLGAVETHFIHDAAEEKNTKTNVKRLSRSKSARRSKSTRRSESSKKTFRKPVIQEMLASQEKELTFKPKINQSYSFTRRQNPDVLERFEEWEQRKGKKPVRTDLSSKERNEETECTFKPKISEKSDKLAVTATNSVPERFIQHEESRNSRLAKAKEVIEKRTMQECTFKPELKTKKRRLLDPRPIWERWRDDTEMMKESKARAQAIHNMHTSSQCTFRPQVNAKSKRIAQRLPHQKLDVTHRLSHAKTSSSSSLKTQSQLHAKADVCDFQPRINKNSERIVKVIGGTFLERQEMFLKQSENRKSKLVKQMQKRARREESFRPDVGNSKRILENSNRHRHRVTCETSQDFYERLSVHDAKRKEQEISIVKENMDPQPTFSPVINPKSKRMGRPSGLDELTNPEKSHRLQIKMRKESEEKFQEEHPFEPKRISRQPQLSIGWKVESREFKNPQHVDVHEYIAEKEEKLKAARAELDKQRMEECTFQPKTCKPRTHVTSNVAIIPGLARFQEMKDLAKKKEMEQKERIAEVFGVSKDCLKSRKMNEKGALYTVPKPFSFVGNSKSNDKKRMSGTQESECTFQPKTLARAQREKVWSILQDDSTETSVDLESIQSETSMLYALYC